MRTQLPSPKKGEQPLIFGPCLLWPNCWMDQDATWHLELDRARPRSRRHCVRWGTQLPQKGHRPPIFGPCLLWPNGWWIKMLPGQEVGLGPGHIVLQGDPAPPQKGAQASNFRPMSIEAKRSPISATAEHLLTLNYYLLEKKVAFIKTKR